MHAYKLGCLVAPRNMSVLINFNRAIKRQKPYISGEFNEFIRTA